MKTSADWILAHDATKGVDAYMLECTRCGQKQRFVLPIAVEIYVVAAKAFEKIHKGCEEKEKDNQTGFTGST